MAKMNRTKYYNLSKSIENAKSPKVKLNRLIRLKNASGAKSTRDEIQKKIKSLREKIGSKRKSRSRKRN